jgi:hypothetical protein
MTNFLTIVHIFVTLYDFREPHIGHNAECHRNLDRPCGLVVKLYQFVLLCLWHQLMSKLLVRTLNMPKFECFRKPLALTESHTKSRIYVL